MSRRATSRRPALLALAAGSWLLLTGQTAAAHDLRPGVLALAETDDGVFDLRFVAPVDSRGETVEVTVELPAGCARDGSRVRCSGGLAGALAVRGMRGESMRTLVRIDRRDGSRDEWIVSAAAPAVELRGSPPPSWLLWLRVGIEHILAGPDHLAFVIGLLLVLGLGLRPVVNRRLLITVSAFTIAHSLTLVLAVSGVVRAPIGAVEACIAASVLLVAREATHSRPTLVRRWPWLAAALFGLVHGFGFASALGNLGLSGTAAAWSLLWFNVGVELGQLAVIAAVGSLVWLIRRLIADAAGLGPRLHGTACYALGGFAAWWLAERVLAVAG